MSGPKVVLIEDNQAVSETLNAALNQSYNLVSTGLGKEGLELVTKEHPAIVMLDLNLPDISGLWVCKQIRKIGVSTPILIITGNDQLSTKLELFSAGADDYIVKPFSLGELQARLKAISRRVATYKQDPMSPRTPSLVLDRASVSVRRDNGQAIVLRHKEYAILELLIKRAGRTVSREQLVDEAWKNTAKPWSNSLDVHVNSLRDKIDKPFDRQLITTVHGVGYRLENA